jgi:FAD/FMN-containing dehydrogenase
VAKTESQDLAGSVRISVSAGAGSTYPSRAGVGPSLFVIAMAGGGAMTRSTSGDVVALRARMAGPVLEPGDAGYDQARSLWNGQFDRHPAVITRCAGPIDVVTAVGFGRQTGLEITVRGGGHSLSGASACDGGLMIDLSLLNHVVVDPQRRRAIVGGGATWADLDAATQAHGLAVTGGIISHTGVGGLTLGGGMGWLDSRHGLSIDNLESAEVVLADGQLVRASTDEHPDLFWALRGGGGNFGVVTTFEYRLHPVGPEVHLALLFWEAERGTEALHACRDLIPTLPNHIGAFIAGALTAEGEPFPPEHHGRTGHALLLVGFGPAAEHAAAVAPVRAACAPLVEFTTPLPYVGLQHMLDASAPWGVHDYDKSLAVTDLTDDVIAVLAERATDKASPMTFMPIFPLRGAYCAVDDDATAFSLPRTTQYVIDLAATSFDPAVCATDRTWVRSIWDTLRPLAHNTGGYINFLGEHDENWVQVAYDPDKYERLAQIKATYDPGNLFHHNANIKPA